MFDCYLRDIKFNREIFYLPVDQLELGIEGEGMDALFRRSKIIQPLSKVVVHG